ncbi:hypothetical protein N7488_004032 [Penicillium malachiteum]|nr:hypothetical protein N7488_004032 [Penicillium malachiteum]
MPNEGFPDIENYNFGTCVNLIALLALGFALLGQSLLALLSYWNNLRDIPSWGSNSLNTTLTMMIHGSVQRAPGRCMAPISTRGTSEAGLMLPRTEQPSQWQISKSARRAIVFIWALAGLSVIWFVAMILVTRSTVIYSLHFSELWAKLGWHFSLAWNPSQKDYMDQSYNAVSFSPDYLNDGSISVVSALVLGLVLVCAIQCLQTLGLHCAELIVDLSRDEDSWRGLDANSSSSRRQKVLRSPSFLKNFLSWKYDILFIFKSLLHWLLGQSVQPYFDERVFFAMYYSRLFVYAIFAICLASVLTFLVMKKPKGPQPATYGHIQTIADVVDDWSLNEEGQFWWGDKGCEGAIRHAGMSSVRDDLGPIKMEAYYAGQYTTQTIHSTTATTAQKN